MRPDFQDAGFLSDVVTAGRQVLTYSENATFDDFQRNSMMRHACERQIEIMGEAARRVSASFRTGHPEIPWRRIIAQRHVLAHEYGEIKVELIWKLITTHIPDLIAKLQAILPSPPPDPEPEA